MGYNFDEIESKWQKRWQQKKIFEVKENPRKKKFYILEMYPYPSATGLHMGHAFNYTVGDIFARFKRMQGFNVLYPMGYDSFGLPAENAAIKAKSHPKKFTEQAVNNFIKQQKALGLSYDWTRMVETHKPDYYKWDQWIFLKMFEKGLVYKKMAPVNFCRKCNTVLANEQVHNGKCWRHEDTEVEIKYLEQWFFKITEYADELYEDIEKLVGWPEDVKAMQKNWIGKSQGTEIDFEVNGKKWPVFTTRPDTVYGVTFMVISAQHPRLMELVTEKQGPLVKKFLKKIKTVSRKSVKEIEELEKEGVFTGNYAINPLTKEKVPIWVGNFVVAEYGGGMVMAVPAHDSRDFEFAKKYKLPVRVVIQPKEPKSAFTTKIKRAYDGDGILVNSRRFNGLENHKAKWNITRYLEGQSLGRKSIQYKLKDWLISRQRFWGTPIPIIYCDKCGIVLVPEEDLPVKLPDNIRFTSEKNPLVDYGKFVNVKCPKCGNKGKRETDTMDTFVNSSWYFLRYCDPKNSKEIFDKKKAEYWMPIDQYIGGKEHACMHLIYFRFYTKFLRDLGLFGKVIDEPTFNLFNQGMVHGSDGAVMAKSKGNVVLPEEVSKKYGIDTARLFLVSLASPDKDVQWSEKSIRGSLKFVMKTIDYFKNVKIGESDARIESKLNTVIKEVTEYIEGLKYNLAIIKIRELFGYLPDEISKDNLEKFLKLLSPFCPHIAEELWEKLHKDKDAGFISLEKWPQADESKIDKNLEKQEGQIGKLIEDINHVIRLMNAKGQKVTKGYVYVIPKEKQIYLKNTNLVKRKTGLDIIIFSSDDRNKYDPQGKSKRARSEKPAIYLG